MKRIYLLFLFCLGVTQMMNAQLSAGDIALVQYNADGNETFKFLALVDIPSGTQIKFTDNGWKSDGTFRSGENTNTYTLSANIACGTVVEVTPSSTGLSGSGDQLIAYIGDASFPTFLAAINAEGSGVWQSNATSSNTSALPTGLTNGTNAIAINEIDNAKYNGSVLSGTKTELLAAINNKNNWSGSDSGEQTFTDSFTVSGCNNANPTCSIASTGLTNQACNNNGTTPDATDDFITFDLNPTGSTLGTNYSVSVLTGYTVNPTTGSYGGTTSFTLTKDSGASADGTAITVTLTDDTDNTCAKTVDITQASCSTPPPTSSTSTGGELTFQMINPCGNDGDNEFVVFTSGNAPITVNDIALGSVNDSSDTSWNYFWSTAENGGSGPTTTQNGNSVTITATNSYGITDPVTDAAKYTAAITELNGITGATTFLAPDPSTGEIPANAAVVFFLGYDNPNNTDGFDTAATNLDFTPQVPNQFYIILGQGKENGGYFSNSDPRTQYITIGQEQTNVSYTPTGGAAAYLLPDGTYVGDGDCIPSGSLSCTATLTEASKTCSGENAGDNDTYTVVLNFTIGGATGPFNITASSGTADKTTISADGTITISGIAETADLTVNLQNTAGDCPLAIVVEAPACDPAPCGVTLGTPTYTCGANTSGNDAVTINIPYTGSDSTITSVTTTAVGATIGGDNPASVSGGTITITGLSEGDTFNLTVNGGVCNGTTIADTVIPTTTCPEGSNTCLGYTTGGIYISEFNWNPSSSQGSDSNCEYIEIFNAYANEVDLADWELKGGVTIKFPENTRIKSGEYFIIAADATAIKNCVGYNLPTDVKIFEYSGALSNSTNETTSLVAVTECNANVNSFTHDTVGIANGDGQSVNLGQDGTTQIAAAISPGQGDCTVTTDLSTCTPKCTATLEPGVVQCETATSGEDTYTATWILEFGIENSVFTVSIPSTSSGTIKSEDVTIDPSVDASPYVITVTGIPEGTSAQLNVTDIAAGGYCDLNSLNEISSPSCSGCDVQPCLVITEIMIDPCSGSSASAIWTQEGHGEYVEILNNCPVAVDISGYQLRDERGTSNYAIFPTGSTIAAGDRLVVGSATVINALKASDSANAAKYYLKGGIGGFGGDNAELDNSTPDGLRLVSCLGDNIDAVDWENPSCITSNDGVSAVLMDVTADNSNINTANWYPTLNGGQPQAQGGGGTPLAANDAGACISDPIFSNVQCPADCIAVDAKISFDISFDYSNAYGTEFDIYFDDAKLTTVSIATGTPPYNGTYTGTLEIDCSSSIGGIRPVEVRAKDALANACYTANADVSIPNCTATPNTCAADATLIAIQDFDSGTPSWNNPFESQLFVDPSSSDEGLFMQAKTQDGPTSNPFKGNTIYGKDLTGESGEPSLPGEQVFVFNDVDVSAYKDVTLSFSHQNNLNGTNDYLKYSYVVDGVESTFMDISGQTGVVTKSDFSPTMQNIGLKIYVQINGGSDFFEMDNFQICGVLAASQPVDLIEFAAVANNQDADLTWETASETNSSYFVVDRSFDGIHFQAIGQVTAEGQAASYTFKDVGVASQSAVVYYRLNQVDIDGSASYSNVVKVDFEQVSDYVVYPNPVKNNESFTVEGKEINTVDIYNPVSQLVSTTEFNGERKVTLSTKQFAKGVYVIIINGTETRKLTVQ